MLKADEKLTQNSYYAASVQRTESHPPLRGDLQVDVCVIGGGLAGISAALELQQRGFNVALLEARQIGFGASGRNGGQVIMGLACDIEVIEAQLGYEAAKQVFAMTAEAIALIHERCATHAIDCEWQAGYLNAAIGPKKAKTLEQWVEQMRIRYGYEQQFIAKPEVSSWIQSNRFTALAYDPLSGHLHPLKYTLGLARAAQSLGVQIFEETAAQRITQGENALIYTDHGAVQCKQVVLAGNVYGTTLAPGLDARIMPVGTYIIGSAPMSKARANALIPSRSAICDTNFVLDYFRLSADDRMIFGGRVSYSTVTPMNLAPTMKARMLKVFPQLSDLQVQYAWGGFVDITMNRAPDFGRLANNVYYLQGFSGHGLALTGLAGKLVAQAIAGDAERFDVFTRLKHHNFPGGKLLRLPALVAAMAWYRLRDLLA
ncbi:MAG: FAD-binding oxidoreductase [Burkholderiaceae bacterium]|nr:FAD-binding oxidoreductase [Burkholderiaceae bacterium]